MGCAARWCCKRATLLSAPEESPVLAMRDIPFTGVLLVLGCYLSGIVDAQKGAICGTAKSPNAHPLPKGMDWASLQLNPMDDCQCNREYFSKKGKGHDCVATEKCADFRLAVGFAEYELHAPTTTSNRICAKVSAQCTAGTVQIANPTATADRKCQAPGPPPPPPTPTPTPSNSLPKVRATCACVSLF
eukprot:COSAG01_NODE_1143_length_11532_cov_7.995977_3_plen_188_part_00